MLWRDTEAGTSLINGGWNGEVLNFEEIIRKKIEGKLYNSIYHNMSKVTAQSNRMFRLSQTISV